MTANSSDDTARQAGSTSAVRGAVGRGPGEGGTRARPRPGVDVALVALAPGARQPLEVLAETLAEVFHEEPGRERLVLLPPLFLHDRGRSAGQEALAERVARWSRAALVLAAHPTASWRELGLLAEHGPIYTALREGAGGLARALQATVVPGTVLLAQPRKHWERWPDEPLVFHVAWAFGPDGEPAGVVRDPAPPAALRDRGVRAGWPPSSSTTLPPRRPRLHVAWPQGRAVAWRAPGVVAAWRPLARGHAGDVDPVRELAVQPAPVGLYAVADAAGVVAWAARRSAGPGPRDRTIVRRGTLRATEAHPVVWEVVHVPDGRLRRHRGAS